MKITELAELVKRAGHCTSKTADKNKKAEKCAYPDCDCQGKCKITGDKIEKSAKDLFGNPTSESTEDTTQKAKASPDSNDNPKGLPKRPSNSNEKESQADTDSIKVPEQSNDAVTGNGDGSEL